MAGVKGMKWGVRKHSKYTVNQYINPLKNINRGITREYLTERKHLTRKSLGVAKIRSRTVLGGIQRFQKFLELKRQRLSRK